MCKAFTFVESFGTVILPHFESHLAAFFHSCFLYCIVYQRTAHPPASELFQDRYIMYVKSPGSLERGKAKKAVRYTGRTIINPGQNTRVEREFFQRFQ